MSQSGESLISASSKNGVADRVRISPVIELRKDLQGIRARVLSPLGGIDIYVAKRDLRIDPVGIGMLFHIREEFFIRRFRLGRDVLEDEFHLLPHPPPDDAVVAIQADGQGLAVVDLVADEVFDQPLRFLFGRRPLPCFRERRDRLIDIVLRDDDLRRRRAGLPGRQRRRAAPPSEEEEQPCADEQEVDQRFSEKLAHLCPAPHPPFP